MVRRCKHCKKEGGSEATSQGRTLHGFPLQDPALMEVWKAQLKLHPSFIPTKYTFICSDHFREKCFRIICKRRVLIPGSVPTLFSERKDRCFYCHSTKDSKPGLSLRKFPLDRSELLKKWLQAINVKNFVPTKDSLICSDHFKRTCFQEIKNRKSFNLKVDAVPSIFIKGTQEVTEKVAQEHMDVPEEEFELDLEKPIADTGNTYQAVPPLFELVTPITRATIAEKGRIVSHDHRYESTRKKDRRQIAIIWQKFKKAQYANKIQKKLIRRLNIKVNSLTEQINELLKRN